MADKHHEHVARVVYIGQMQSFTAIDYSSNKLSVDHCEHTESSESVCWDCTSRNQSQILSEQANGTLFVAQRCIHHVHMYLRMKVTQGSHSSSLN
jgi:hypothetical protein